MIGMIAAMSADSIIGINGKIPFNYPEDLIHFKNTTINSTVIMGRKTFESIGKPLPNRKNIVISNTLDNVPGIEIYNSLEKAIVKNKEDNIWLIGGTSIYEEGMKFADTILLTVTPDIILTNDSLYNHIARFPNINNLFFYKNNISYIETSSNIKLNIFEFKRF